ncbi:MAG: hypothetical protein ACI3XQ_01585 [Eubacteriales bacterium]
MIVKNKCLRPVAIIAAIIMVLTSLSACSDGGDGEASEATEITTAQDAYNSLDKDFLTNAVFYSNDLAHCMNLVSPYNPTKTNTLSKYLLKSAVDEALDGGADVFVTELYGWTPFYPSEVYSIEEHIDWFYNEYGGKQRMNGVQNYVLGGGDPINDQLERAHQKDKQYFISFRLNDHHYLANINNPEVMNQTNASRIYYENPEWRIGQVLDDSGKIYSQVVWDFSFEGVRDYKLSLITELIENYDIDGMIIDLMRCPYYFNQERTPKEADRVAIMTDFIASIRQALDEKTAITGIEYCLGLKVPQNNGCYSQMGLDLSKMYYDAGVDMFVFCEGYTTHNDWSYMEEIRALLPEALLYAELYQVSSRVGDDVTGNRIMTAEQYYTSAYLAYKRGADGIYLFNFPFYRENGYEPPFEIFPQLKDIEFLESSAQHYFIGLTLNLLVHNNNLNESYLFTGRSITFELDMQEPVGGWSTDGILRLESSSDLTSSTFAVTVNGVLLESTTVTAEPYISQYTQSTGEPDNWVSYIVPRDILKSGKNEIVVLQTGGNVTVLNFVDLAIK